MGKGANTFQSEFYCLFYFKDDIENSILFQDSTMGFRKGELGWLASINFCERFNKSYWIILINEVHGTWLKILVIGLHIRHPQTREDDRTAPFALFLCESYVLWWYQDYSENDKPNTASKSISEYQVSLLILLS